MKYCPECGIRLDGSEILVCPNCRASLGAQKSSKTKKQKNPKNPKEKTRKVKREDRKKKKSEKVSISEQPQPMDDGYDGYYDDVLPPDMDRVSEGVDKELVKKIVILVVGVAFTIGACVAMLYFL